MRRLWPLFLLSIALCDTSSSATTAAAKATKNPIVQNPRRWIVKKGNVLHRGFHLDSLTHYYTTTSKIPNGFKEEVSPGNIVSEADWPEVKAACPELLKVSIWRKGNASYIGNKAPQGFTETKEKFYCSPRQFYCQANFRLRQLNKNNSESIFYASSDPEAYAQMVGYPPHVYKSVFYAEQPCWIWQNYKDTWFSIVRARGSMLHRAYHQGDLVHRYSLSAQTLPDGWNSNPGPGYVVEEELYQEYFKKQCPDLIKMSVFQGKNSKGQLVSYIGLNPPEGFDYKQEGQFYCAKKFNYCNASYLLRRLVKTDGSSNLYPNNDSEARNQLAGMPPGLFKAKNYTEAPCYIWPGYQTRRW